MRVHEDSPTNKFPDGNFSQARLAVFALSSLRSDKLTQRSGFRVLTKAVAFSVPSASLRVHEDSNLGWRFWRPLFYQLNYRPVEIVYSRKLKVKSKKSHGVAFLPNTYYLQPATKINLQNKFISSLLCEEYVSGTIYKTS